MEYPAKKNSDDFVLKLTMKSYLLWNRRQAFHLISLFRLVFLHLVHHILDFSSWYQEIKLIITSFYCIHSEGCKGNGEGALNYNLLVCFFSLGRVPVEEVRTGVVGVMGCWWSLTPSSCILSSNHLKNHASALTSCLPFFSHFCIIPADVRSMHQTCTVCIE